MTRLGVVAAAVVAACQFTHGSSSNGDGRIVDVFFPDVGPCSSVTTTCQGDDLVACTTQGDAPMVTHCNWGCNAAGNPPACFELAPSGGWAMTGDTTGLPSGSGTTLGATIIINGDDGSIGLSGNPNVRVAGTGRISNIDFEIRASDHVAMFRFSSLTITGPVTLVSNSMDRSIALVSDGPIVIDDVLDARGFCGTTFPGPGGFSGGAAQASASGSGSGQVGLTTGGGNNGGGGGGGYGGSGGSGAAGNGGAGGAAFGDLTVAILVGGGGGGGGETNNSGAGGGGGGALHLISNTSITISGGVNAGGCGGQDGKGGGDGGGGGGAGGTLLLEAPSITITGALAANGGGGGACGDNPQGQANAGSLDRNPAPGDTLGNCANGGDGAAGATAGGSQGSSGAGHAGGGGGGIGIIRLNTRANAGLAAGSATLSPGLSDPSTTCTQGSASLQ